MLLKVSIMLGGKKVTSFTQFILFAYLMLFSLLCFPDSTSSPSKSATPATEVIIFSHYDTPPFLTASKTGLTYKLAEALNHLAKGRYYFRVQILPRKRLDKTLENPNWFGMVPWVNPAWFKDAEQTKFSWSTPMMKDENLVISHQNKPINFNGPQSLVGLELGGILGHRYIEIETLIWENKITRFNVVSEVQNIEKLLRQRIDVMFISKSSLNFYLNQHPNFQQHIFIANQIRGSFHRYILLPKKDHALTSFINHAINELGKQPEWKNLLPD